MQAPEDIARAEQETQGPAEEAEPRTIVDEIKKVLNETLNISLNDFFGDGMFITVRLSASDEHDVKVEELAAGEVSELQS